MADDLKRNGGLIPKVRPGKETADYLDDILSKITFFNSICGVIINLCNCDLQLKSLSQNTLNSQ